MFQKTVLIVDDNDELRALLSETLSLDYDVLTARNGEEAIDVLTNQEIDLVLLDVEMPITDGFETLRVIRDEHNGWPHIPVVMLTVRNEPETVLKAWNIGADIYMTKPFSTTELLETVQRALNIGIVQEWHD